MQKNVVIAMLMILIAVLSVLWYRAARASKTAIAQISVVVEKQSQICLELSSQVRWLRRHLEKTLGLLETEHSLEPIPLQFFYDPPDKKTSPSEYLTEPNLFVTPYEKPEYRHFDISPNRLGLLRLSAFAALSCQGAILATADMDTLIDNLYQRLQRLETKIKK